MQTQTDSTAPPAAKSLPARYAGILFAPRATYAAIVAHPKWLGIFVVVLVISVAASTGLLSTEVGRNAVIDAQVAARPMTQAQIDQIEKIAPYFVYIAPVFQLIGFSVGGLVIAGVAFAVFNAMLGGDATFKQVFAVVAHSGVILATLSIVTTPLAYVRGTLSGTTNLGVFLPFLDETSFAAKFLGSIDLIVIWWLFSVAIGLGVLYRKRTGPIAHDALRHLRGDRPRSSRRSSGLQELVCRARTCSSRSRRPVVAQASSGPISSSRGQGHSRSPPRRSRRGISRRSCRRPARSRPSGRSTSAPTRSAASSTSRWTKATGSSRASSSSRSTPRRCGRGSTAARRR